VACGDVAGFARSLEVLADHANRSQSVDSLH
jgi:hypothetical protein